jgi:protein-tyrosine phosphatase
VIDLHCHVLPGIDDGPETMDEAIELARAAAAQGTTVLVATPHVTYDHRHNTSERILAAVEEVNRAVRRQRIDIMVLPGAEVALERAGELEDDELAALRLGGGPWLLVECPMFAGGMGVDGQLHALASRGNRIVLAHPEHCPVFQTDLTRLERLIEAGMLAQVTASALTGQFGRVVERIAKDMVGRDLIHVAASDAHNAGRRPPVIRDHLEDAGLDGMVDWLGREVPEAVLAGTAIPYRPRADRASSRRGLLGRRRSRR